MTPPPDLSTCRNGHRMTKKNTYIRRSRGKEYQCCVTCRRLTWMRYRRKAGADVGTKPKRAEANRELLRTKVYAMPDSEYRTAMIEAFALYDAWLATDKRPQRFGRKYPQQKAAPKPRRKAA